MTARFRLRYGAAMHDIHIIGGGLAGSEAAWQLAEAGVPRPPVRNARVGRDDRRRTRPIGLAELVCSNSFRSDDAEQQRGRAAPCRDARAGLADHARGATRTRCPPARRWRSTATALPTASPRAIAAHPNIELVRERVDALPDGPAIVATGPLTAAGARRQRSRAATGQDALAFFDAIAPIVHRDSIDMDIAWFQSRWNKGDGKDYINCPMDKDAVSRLHRRRCSTGEKTEFKEWEKDTPYFDGCMPIEVMAERGVDTLRYGPMKPVGLDDPRTGRWPYAVVQLRQDNALGTLWNIVGFQTKLKHAEQVRAVPHHPGAARTPSSRGWAGCTATPSSTRPSCSTATLRLKSRPQYPLRRPDHRLRGLCRKRRDRAARRALRRRRAARATPSPPPPRRRPRSARCSATSPAAPRPTTYQPMNVNFGLFPPLAGAARARPIARR